MLRQWHASYLHGGFEALLPAWKPVSEITWYVIEQRYVQLGACAEAETLSSEDLERLAQNQGWTMHQAKRWLSRYRVGGMMGLAPATRPAKARALPAMGALSEAQRDELFRRHALLGDLAKQDHVPNAQMLARAKAVGVSLRTLPGSRVIRVALDAERMQPGNSANSCGSLKSISLSGWSFRPPIPFLLALTTVVKVLLL